MMDQSMIMASEDRWSIMKIDDQSFLTMKQADLYVVKLLTFTYFTDRALKFLNYMLLTSTEDLLGILDV